MVAEVVSHLRKNTQDAPVSELNVFTENRLGLHFGRRWCGSSFAGGIVDGLARNLTSTLLPWPILPTTRILLRASESSEENRIRQKWRVQCCALLLQSEHRRVV